MQHLLIHSDYSALMFHPVTKREGGVKERTRCEENIDSWNLFSGFPCSL